MVEFPSVLKREMMEDDEGHDLHRLDLAERGHQQHHVSDLCEGDEMIRRTFMMRLKPGALEEYKKRHDEIWPELVDEIRACGIKSMTTVVDGNTLILFSEIESDDAWARLWHSDVHRRWGEVMNPLMAFRDDGIVDSKDLVEVFHLETQADN
jgi:L-rhamnose mutarotase